MPLYLVKWDDGSFALVSAEDDDALVFTLDQLADPGAASWQVWDGPLWLEFPRIGADLPPDAEVDPFELGLGRPSVAETDEGAAFADAVLAAVHPNLAALREKAMHEERAISSADLDAAVKADLGYALPGSVFGEDEGPEQ